MRIDVQKLTNEKFNRYGTFVNLTAAAGDKIGESPVEFFRDIARFYNPSTNTSLSCCKLHKRDFSFDEVEFHSTCDELTLPIDSDMVVIVGAASPRNSMPTAYEAFLVPVGTAVVLKPGVWHGAPFPLKDAGNALVLLPERTYYNDCIVEKMPQKCHIDF